MVLEIKQVTTPQWGEGGMFGRKNKAGFYMLVKLSFLIWVLIIWGCFHSVKIHVICTCFGMDVILHLKKKSHDLLEFPKHSPDISLNF